MVIFGEASVSIPLMHNVARNNMSATLHMPRTCANGPNLREVGMRERQPNRTPPGTQLGERAQCSVSGPGSSRFAWLQRSLRSLCGGPAVSVSGPGGLCVRARHPFRRSAVSALSVSGALCVGARRSLCRARPPLSRSLCQAPARFLCRTLAGSLCRRPVLSVSGPGVLSVEPQRCRSLCRVRRSLSRLLSVSEPDALCQTPLSVSGPGTLPVRWAPAVSVLSRRSPLCRAPALFAAHRSLCVGSSGSAGPQPRSACSCACHSAAPWAPN